MLSLTARLEALGFHVGQTWDDVSLEVIGADGIQVMIGSVSRVEKWIAQGCPQVDPSLTYKTRSGKRLIRLNLTCWNSAGSLVTYPVKASVVLKEKPLKLGYMIWSIEGKRNVMQESEDDLVLS
jgi:hypothetical protein